MPTILGSFYQFVFSLFLSHFIRPVFSVTFHFGVCKKLVQFRLDMHIALFLYATSNSPHELFIRIFGWNVLDTHSLHQDKKTCWINSSPVWNLCFTCSLLQNYQFPIATWSAHIKHGMDWMNQKVKITVWTILHL